MIFTATFRAWAATRVSLPDALLCSIRGVTEGFPAVVCPTS